MRGGCFASCSSGLELAVPKNKLNGRAIKVNPSARGEIGGLFGNQDHNGIDRSLPRFCGCGEGLAFDCVSCCYNTVSQLVTPKRDPTTGRIIEWNRLFIPPQHLMLDLPFDRCTGDEIQMQSSVVLLHEFTSEWLQVYKVHSNQAREGCSPMMRCECYAYHVASCL